MQKTRPTWALIAAGACVLGALGVIVYGFASLAQSLAVTGVANGFLWLAALAGLIAAGSYFLDRRA